MSVCVSVCVCVCVCVSSLFPPGDSKSVCMCRRQASTRWQKSSIPSPRLASVRIWETIFKKLSPRAAQIYLTADSFLVNYPAAQTWTSSRSFAATKAWKYFLKRKKKRMSIWNWGCSTTARMTSSSTVPVKSSFTTDGFYGGVHPSKHYHSLKYVPCGLNCSQFEVFSLSLLSCFSRQSLQADECAVLLHPAVEVKVRARISRLIQLGPNCICSAYCVALY